MSLPQFFRQSCYKLKIKTLKLWHTGTNVSVISNRRCHSTLDISGIFPPIPTPFDNDQSVSYRKLKRNFDIWNQVPFSGYVVQGSNGEYPFLTSEERVEVVKNVKEIMPKDKLLIAGSGCESTTATIEMSNAMADCGADAVLVVTPSFFKNQMLSPALIKHYLTVADEAKVPVILYNVPSNTGINIPVEAVVRLSKHPNICGIKDSGGDISRIGLTVHKTKDSGGFQVLAGSAGFLLASYTVGAVGGVCALANVLGQEVCNLAQLYYEGDMMKATELQHRLIAPNSAITALFGVPGLKAALPWFGLDGGIPRPPLQILNDESKAIVRKAFEDNGFL